MSRATNPSTTAKPSDRGKLFAILALALATAALYGWLAGLGDLGDRPGSFLPLYGLLLALMVAAWAVVRRADRRAWRLALAAALAFRVIAAVGEPALSDDVYRYVWDGRVQSAGVHPYRYAPADPALEPLRDDVWRRINHPDVATIYPPLAQMVFLGLASAGAGPRGFKLTAGLLDFAVALALARLLRDAKLPRDRVVLYAWNPLAVVETAGSGHYEPLGVLLVVLAAAWMAKDRPARSALGMAAAVQLKLFPVVLLPGYLRRWKAASIVVFVGAFVVIGLPYALTGPAVGAGTLDYARQWERNAFLFEGIRHATEVLDPSESLTAALTWLKERLGESALPWDLLYRNVWPASLARAAAAALALAWVIAVSFRKNLDAARESLLALGGVLLLSPTIHPWYLLWVLPFAVAFLSRGWILLAALSALAYVGGEADVPWGVRAVEFGVPLVVMAWDAARSRSGSMRA